MMIGHFARDRVVVDGQSALYSGGAVYYGSVALRRLGVSVAVVTRLHPNDFHFLAELEQEDVVVFATPAPQTSGIENRYNSADMERRVCRPLGFAGPIQRADIPPVSAAIYAITPIMAGFLVVALGLLALSLDLGQIFVGKNELQNIADAAALAGAKKLIQAKDPNNPYVAAVYCDEAISTAQSVASQNKSFGAAMTVTAADVVLGQWNLTTGAFTRTGCSTNPMEVTAIQVTVRRDGTDNPSLATFFGNFFGVSSMKTTATAVAYLGVAGTASLDLPFAVPTNYPAGQAPYAKRQPLGPWFGPPAAEAANPQPYTWKDLGGTSLDTTRATFIMPLYAERTDLSKLQKYIKGPGVTGGLQYPQVKVGQTVYPISEWQWTSNVYNNFDYLKTRYQAAPKIPGTNKWRITAAVYGTSPVTASTSTNSWLRLANALLPGPNPAYACSSYTSPQVYVQGFITLDITKVMCDKNGDGVWDNQCTSYAYPSTDSCWKKCYLELEVPLTQNFTTTDRTSNPAPYQRDYRDINPGASEVGAFASTPFLVK